MTTHRNALVLILVAAIATTSVTPTLAKPNNGAYARSGEAFKQKMYADYCAGLKSDFDKAEKEADKRGGTKEAAPYAKQADDIWGYGHEAGCGWAA